MQLNMMCLVHPLEAIEKIRKMVLEMPVWLAYVIVGLMMEDVYLF